MTHKTRISFPGSSLSLKNKQDLVRMTTVHKPLLEKLQVTKARFRFLWTQICFPEGGRINTDLTKLEQSLCRAERTELRVSCAPLLRISQSNELGASIFL